MSEYKKLWIDNQKRIDNVDKVKDSTPVDSALNKLITTIREGLVWGLEAQSLTRDKAIKKCHVEKRSGRRNTAWRGINNILLQRIARLGKWSINTVGSACVYTLDMANHLIGTATTDLRKKEANTSNPLAAGLRGFGDVTLRQGLRNLLYEVFGNNENKKNLAMNIASSRNG